jgi:hypothetical protein
MSIQSNEVHDESFSPIQDAFLSLLQSYAHISNGTRITLVVGGFLISGQLATHEEYTEYFAHKIGEQLVIVSEEKGVDENYSNVDLLKKKYQSSEQYSIGYINLKNARICHPSGDPIPSDTTIFWRGKIESVDGFFLESLVS